MTARPRGVRRPRNRTLGGNLGDGHDAPARGLHHYLGTALELPEVAAVQLVNSLQLAGRGLALEVPNDPVRAHVALSQPALKVYASPCGLAEQTQSLWRRSPTTGGYATSAHVSGRPVRECEGCRPIRSI
jgi:hypothetical protein